MEIPSAWLTVSPISTLLQILTPKDVLKYVLSVRTTMLNPTLEPVFLNARHHLSCLLTFPQDTVCQFVQPFLLSSPSTQVEFVQPIVPMILGLTIIHEFV